MSSPFRTPLSGSMIIGGCVMAISGAVLWLGSRLGASETAGGETRLLVVAFAGMVLLFAGVWVHDHQHIRRGESPHAMWGENDRNRPVWLPRRRP